MSEAFFEALTSASNYGVQFRQPDHRRVSVGAVLTAPPRGHRARQALIALIAVATASLILAGLVWLVSEGRPAPPPRSPFGIGFREAAPAATGLGSWILALQSSFSRSLQAAVHALKADGAWGPMMGLGFAYGVFHAAGPGHGKAVIAGYIVAGERALTRGFSLSFAAALLQRWWPSPSWAWVPWCWAPPPLA